MDFYLIMYVFEEKSPDICPCCGLRALTEKNDYKVVEEDEEIMSDLYVCFYCGNSVLKQKDGEIYKYSYHISLKDELIRKCNKDIGYGFDIERAYNCDFIYNEDEIDRDKWIELFADRLLLLRSQVEN